MRAFRNLMIVLMLLCLVPPLSLFAATLVARWAKCELDPSTPVPCTIFGGDFGDVLFKVADFGYYAVETIPTFVALLAVWLIVEIVRSFGRGKRAPQPKVPAPARRLRQPPAPAASRNRARGS